MDIKQIKREPESPYECWTMDCKECIYYKPSTEESDYGCTHPELIFNPQ